jgi:hypothetical protein
MKTEYLLELFDGDKIGPGMRNPPFGIAAGGGLPENQAGGDARVYFPGGSAPLKEAMVEREEAGPSGYMLTGGARRKKNRRSRRRQTKRKQRGGKRRATGRRNGSAFRLNLRAQIRM